MLQNPKISFTPLSPLQVARRSKSIPTICVIGPTGSGKTTLIYAILNHRIVGIIQVGIGEKKQTTIIPTNFICDQRIQNENSVALKIKMKPFAAKDVHYKVMIQLADLYNDKDIDSEEWEENLDNEFLEKVLEPEDKAYHLKDLLSVIDIETMRKVLLPLLYAADEAEPSFSERISEKKKLYPKSSKKPMSEIRRMVFEDIIEELGEQSENWQRYYDWLNTIGEYICDQLHKVIGEIPTNDRIFEFELDDNSATEGEKVLRELFNPYKPYSLIVEEMTLISRPRRELIDLNKEEYPLRFCLRDTMGLNQLDDGEAFVKEALEVALSSMPDSILLLLNLEERDKTLSESCDAIEKKLKLADKKDVPIRILLTKADRLIETKINSNKEAVTMQLTDYEKHILGAIKEVEELKNPYLKMFPNQMVDWISLRYHEEKIDPIQLSLKMHQSDYISKFTPEGLYSTIYDSIEDTQKRVLPQGVEYPVFVSVIDESQPAICFEANDKFIDDEVNGLQNELTTDKAVVNGYQITDPIKIHGRSVVGYYRNLKQGRGYTTNAKVYGNFSINMKGLIYKLLGNYVPEFATLYNAKAINTISNNISAEDVENLIRKMDPSGLMTEMALKDVNPTLVATEDERNAQIIHFLFKNYFINSDKYYSVIDKVAKELSYDNSWIGTQIDEVYQLPISYDETIRRMQERFLDIFKTDEFRRLIAQEIGKAMTELANKMFIVI